MKSVKDAFHISLSSAQRIVDQFLQAVVDCVHEDCVIELPPNDKLEEIAQEWSKLSTPRGFMFGCVLAIDGFLSPEILCHCLLTTPSHCPMNCSSHSVDQLNGN
jgi:hypothetical protein